VLLLLPIKTHSEVHRWPWANHALIVANIAIYAVITLTASFTRFHAEGPVDLREPWLLVPTDLRLISFFSYQFVHGDIWHLGGNLLFLWLFGNSVNDKLGNIAYLMFYLACGVFAGVGFCLTSTNPCLGSSGAIAGITTAYLVLFPRAMVTVFYWLWFTIGTMQVQALLLIGLKIILWDNILSPRLSGGQDVVQVAYSAHLAGYLFGFVVCLGMLVVRALPRDQYDVLALVRRYNQRRQFRAAMASPEARAQAQFGRVARPVSADRESWDAPVELSHAARLRSDIADLLAQRRYADAADRYEQFAAAEPEGCLPRRQMLEVANQLMALQRHPQAAGAYERYLKAYPTDSEATQVKLLLGIIYAKYLEQHEAAVRYLKDCVDRLTNAKQAEQARHWLDASSTALGRPGEA
jgi:membrane associated rhomboid family serine protease